MAFARMLKALRNHKSVSATKFNQMHFEGELNDSFGPAFAPSLVNTSHEIAKGQRLSLGTDFQLRILTDFHNTIIAFAE